MIKSCACAPANIALIKYMGKKDGPTANLAENPSLSLTLDSLCSFAEVSVNPAALRSPPGVPGVEGANWIPELPALLPEEGSSRAAVPTLGADGRVRVLMHLRHCLRLGPAILAQHGVPSEPVDSHGLELRTANTFPLSSGIASSASSFAAVTLAAVSLSAANSEAFVAAWERQPSLRRALSRLSRVGSGSSCRSLEGPWMLWEGEEAVPVPSAIPELTDFVILISGAPKKTPSSRAHQLVKTSPLWASRPERATERLEKARAALESGALRELANLSWVEAWEMHSLFHTAAEPFSYWEPGTIDALHFLARLLKEEPPPIVTLDAGPNIHVLVESDRAARWRGILSGRFGSGNLLEDKQGSGARWVGGI